MIGEIARDLIIKWKSNVSPQKIEKIETESRGGEEKAKIKDKTSISLASTSTAVVTNDKDHWKDVSLDLLGEKAIEKSKKKLKSSRGHVKPILVSIFFLFYSEFFDTLMFMIDVTNSNSLLK